LVHQSLNDWRQISLTRRARDAGHLA
jgi:hypothetical protein